MTKDTVLMQLETNFNDLWNLSSTELEIELGRRLELTKRELYSAAELTAAHPMLPALDEAVLMGPTDFLRKTARKFLSKFNQQLYSLVCNPDDPDHKTIQEAYATGVERLGLVLAGMFAVYFGWLPGIAVVIATIVAKRFVKASHEAVCESWKEEFE